MTATFVHVEVLPQFVSQFIEATEENHRNSILEAGNLRFDVLQDPIENNRFILYEVYTSEETAAAHKKTEHYLKWRDTVADWMASPRKGVPQTILFPKK